MRIELTERFLDESEAAHFHEFPAYPPSCYKYRRIYPKLTDLRYPREIPDDAGHCQMEFWDGCIIVIQGNYDEVCILMDDWERRDAEGEPE